MLRCRLPQGVWRKAITGGVACKCFKIQMGLRRAFVERAMSVIQETDNMDVFDVIQFAHLHQHLEVDDLIHRIVIRIRDPNQSILFIL